MQGYQTGGTGTRTTGLMRTGARDPSRSDRSSGGAVVLLNMGLDPIEQATIQIRAPKTTVHLCIGKGLRRLPLRTIRSGCVVQLGRIEPWPTMVLLFGELPGHRIKFC